MDQEIKAYQDGVYATLKMMKFKFELLKFTSADQCIDFIDRTMNEMLSMSTRNLDEE